MTIVGSKELNNNSVPITQAIVLMPRYLERKMGQGPYTSPILKELQRFSLRI
jgi:hypothetical protein